MSKAVLISIRPKWCELIAAKKKPVELRKTRPKIEPPFKCYIYCTKDPGNEGISTHFYESEDGHFYSANKTYKAFLSGTIIGEFLCDNTGKHYLNSVTCKKLSELSCVPSDEIHIYAQPHDFVYGWNISNLVIYDMPKYLCDFQLYCNHREDCCTCKRWSAKSFDCIAGLKRPPQSWCYVEELT